MRFFFPQKERQTPPLFTSPPLFSLISQSPKSNRRHHVLLVPHFVSRPASDHRPRAAPRPRRSGGGDDDMGMKSQMDCSVKWPADAAVGIYSTTLCRLQIKKNGLLSSTLNHHPRSPSPSLSLSQYPPPSGRRRRPTLTVTLPDNDEPTAIGFVPNIAIHSCMHACMHASPNNSPSCAH